MYHAMKKIYLMLMFLSFVAVATAQKLPDVQTSSLPAPTNIKIDGKANEWNETFAADNKRTEVIYSLANDHKNLYLVIKSTSTANANKIMAGGLTFSINAAGNKREKESYHITYPLIKRPERGQGQNRQAQGGFQNRSQQSTQQRDSAALVLRKTQLAGVKEIKVGGFNQITDSLISIYNEYGIKAVASFDSKGEYIYELAIPLALLNLSDDDGRSFAYQIKINGLVNMGFGGAAANAGRTPGAGNGGGFGGGARGGANGNGGFQRGGSGTNDLMNATDFWGKYTLAKPQ